MRREFVLGLGLETIIFLNRGGIKTTGKNGFNEFFDDDYILTVHTVLYSK